MTAEEKRGGLVFFGKGNCVACHAVAGKANEMFSDFENHVTGVPQIAPVFGAGTGNVVFDGPGKDEDFGARAGDSRRQSRRPLQVPHLAAPQSRVAAGILPQRRVHAIEGATRSFAAVRSARSTTPRGPGIDKDLSASGWDRSTGARRGSIRCLPAGFDLDLTPVTTHVDPVRHHRSARPPGPPGESVSARPPLPCRAGLPVITIKGCLFQARPLPLSVPGSPFIHLLDVRDGPADNRSQRLHALCTGFVHCCCTVRAVRLSRSAGAASHQRSAGLQPAKEIR